MAATRVKATGKISWTGVTSNGSFATLPSVGNSIIIVMSGAGATIDFSAVSDNQGGSNGWSQAVQSAAPDANRSRAAVWYCQNVVTSAGTFTITVTHTNGQGQWSAVEYSGMLTSGMIDRVLSAHSSSAVNPTVGPTSSTAQADEVVASSMCIRATQASITVDSGTQEYETLDFATDEPGEGDTKIISAVGAQTTTWTVGSVSANGWSAAIATFKVAGAASGPPFPDPQRVDQAASIVLRGKVFRGNVFR